MPAEVFEDGLDLQIGLLEAQTPEAAFGSPYPPLRSLGQTEMRTFRTILLENPYLRVTILPGLGGRVISLFDKRTNTEILRRHPEVVPVSGGPRGVSVREGIQVELHNSARHNSLGNLDSHIEHQVDEEDLASVWLAESVTGSGLAFHVRYSLPADRAALEIEVRMFNRSLTPEAYDGGLRVYMADAETQGTCAFDRNRSAGISFETGDLTRLERVDGDVHLRRFSGAAVLAPRQSDSWRVELSVVSGIANLLSANNEAAFGFGEGTLQVQSSVLRLGSKVVLLSSADQTLEAPVDLYPENLLEIEIGSAPKGLVLLDATGAEVLRYEAGTPEVVRLGVAAPLNATSTLSVDSTPAKLRAATFSVADRAVANLLLGYQEMRSGEYRKADHYFEQSLLFNAEDPLAWWAKALARRLYAEDEEERTELLNAHFLAPLEPALRAESFLSQAQTMGKDPNPILAPLAENPENFIDVACLLIEMGLFGEATRWMDEAVRHRDLPMLRYLQAYCFLIGSRMAAEAAEQVAIAARLGFGSPYPFRAIERTALETLVERFPADECLQRYLA